MISKTAGLIETKSSFNGLRQRLCFVPIGMDPVQGAENCVFYISNFNDLFFVSYKVFLYVVFQQILSSYRFQDIRGSKWDKRPII
jgi:hypothetical protein